MIDINTEEVRELMISIEDNLKNIVDIEKVTKFAKIVQLKQPDVSNWKNGKIKWSYEKILEVIDKYILYKENN